MQFVGVMTSLPTKALTVVVRPPSNCAVASPHHLDSRRSYRDSLKRPGIFDCLVSSHILKQKMASLMLVVFLVEVAVHVINAVGASSINNLV